MSQVTIVAFTLLCALCFASCLPLARFINFDDCGSTFGKFTEISVGCDSNNEKCILFFRGSNESISIKFMPNKDISQVNVYGVLIDIPIPFPLNELDVCKDPNDGVNCPLHKDEEYHYTTIIFVEKKFPVVRLY